MNFGRLFTFAFFSWASISAAQAQAQAQDQALRPVIDAASAIEDGFLIALLADYETVLGDANSFERALSGDRVCLTACKQFGQSPVSIVGEPSSSDLLRILMNTKFGFLNGAGHRWEALRRVDNVIEKIGVNDIRLNEKDKKYLLNDFRNLVEEAQNASLQEYKFISALIRKADDLRAPNDED